ncbi:MAG: Gfo/Idh/MocA family oxidoreductase, partial [Saprospiraceae bacterium]|nr:Gfo/Idh/MocA family oxidoreductase [Saprospiraceae bacterium]
LKQTPFHMAGIYDPVLSENVIDENIKVYTNAEDLINNSDACIIASTTSSHYGLAKLDLKHEKHLFLEKPMTSTIDQSSELVRMSAERPSLITQVGFVERHNPAYLYLKPYINKPRFIEVHRLSTFNPRGNDVSVVYDLMIHDLDLILAMMQPEISEIRSNGVKVVSDNLDICSARLEFEDGSVANLTASRISMKKMRKFRLFQENGYLSMDLDKKESQIVKLSDLEFENAIPMSFGEQKKYMSIKSSGILEGNAILSELNEFYNSIQSGKASKADLANAYETTLLADTIERTALDALKNE